MARKFERNKEPDDHTIELPPGVASLADRMRSVSSGPPCLVVLGGLDVGATLLLDIPEIVVGRDEECHHVLSDDGISRRHASFVWKDGGYEIDDLESTNGVFVNGERVTSSMLADGDKILLGQFTVSKHTRQDEFELEYQHRLRLRAHPGR